MSSDVENITLWRYVVREKNPGGFSTWGIFMLDSTGYFSVISDYGNYIYRWTSFGQEDFRQFLLGLDKGYFLGKVSKRSELRLRDTEEAIKEQLIERKKDILASRRDGSYTAEEARKEWEEVEEEWELVDGLGGGGDVEFTDWCRDTKISDPWEYAQYDFPGDALGFWKRIWPMFVERLKAELAS